MIGRLHSIQSLGTVDGPGVRAVAFLSGCPLRCAFCHNPDTWELGAGSEIEASELARRLLRFRPYFGRDGGVTLSGGEPLLQAAFSAELFSHLKAEGIHTALDTSGCLGVTDAIRAVLDQTDYVLLDVKFDTDGEYREYTGGGIAPTLALLDELTLRRIPTRIRRVVIPGITDTEDSALRLAELSLRYPAVESVELLPFRKLCLPKYQSMEIPFPLAHLPEAEQSRVDHLQMLIDQQILKTKQ